MSGKPFYITTPIYYVNDVPHIGHAYTTIAADVLARFHRLLGDDVFFLTGTDEHGQKIELQAKKNNETPLELANRVVEKFRESWATLNISYDNFIRTTEERHKKTVINIVNKVIANGDLYLGEYEDWYCVSCETFFTEKQLIDGRCPNTECRRPVQKLKEESYFFRMSKYEKPLLDYIEKHPEFIQPETRRNEVASFIREGLKDLSISRTTFEWGIPMPQTPKTASTTKKHVIYVWFEALMNYLSGISYGTDNKKFNHYWSNVTHLVGKDILRFHAVYWPTMLMSIGAPLPIRIFAHGWWTSEGEKISKSKENVIDPLEIVSTFGLDAFRYFLLREIPFGVDGDFSKKAFITRTNGDLANDLGNLLSRATNMISKYCGGKVPPKEANPGPPDRELIDLSQRVVSETKKYIDEIAFSKALSSIWTLVRSTNQYIEKSAPWKLAKEGEQKGPKTKMLQALYNTLESLRIAALLLYPFMPGSAARIWKDIGLKTDIGAIKNLQIETEWGGLPSGSSVTIGKSLFPRIEQK